MKTAEGQANAATFSRLCTGLRDKAESVFGPDPGLIRLRGATRAVIAGAGALAILIPTLGSGGKAGIALGFMCGILASKLVRADSERGEAITLCALFPFSVGAAWLAAVLEPAKWLVDLTFVLVVAVASLSQLAGARGRSIGMVIFIGYFIGLVTRPGGGALPELAGGAAAGLMMAALTRFVIMPDRPALALTRIVNGLNGRILRILQTARTIVAGELAGSEPESLLHREIGKLNDFVVATNAELERIRSAVEEKGADLGSALLEVEFAAEKVARYALEHKRDPEELTPDLERLIASLEAPETPAGADMRLQSNILRKLEQARRALGKAAKSVSVSAATEGPGPRSADEVRLDLSKIMSNPVVRQAIQSSVAAAIALIAGGLLSERRSYWAVIAAFIVMNGVGSRAETLIKAGQRVLGTLLGVAIGLALATLVIGHTQVALALVLLCVFLSYYAFQEAYGVMIFGVTLMLSLLYAVIGQLSAQLLMLRLEETCVGAGAAIVATIFVLPRRQRDAFRDSLREFVAAMRDALAQGAETAFDSESAETVLRMRSKSQSMRKSLAALKRGWPSLLANDLRKVVRSALRCDYLTREVLASATVSAGDRCELLGMIDAILLQLQGDAHTRSVPNASTGDGPAGDLSLELRRLAMEIRTMT